MVVIFFVIGKLGEGEVGSREWYSCRGAAAQGDEVGNLEILFPECGREGYREDGGGAELEVDRIPGKVKRWGYYDDLIVLRGEAGREGQQMWLGCPDILKTGKDKGGVLFIDDALSDEVKVGGYPVGGAGKVVVLANFFNKFVD